MRETREKLVPSLKAVLAAPFQMAAVAILLVLVTLVVSGASTHANSWNSYYIKDDGGSVIACGIEVLGRLNAGYEVKSSMLNIECLDRRQVVRVEVRNFDFGIAPVRVRWSVDGEPERAGMWETCQDGSCIGLWDGSSTSFLNSLQNAHSVQLAIEVSFAKPMAATFRVDGIREAMAEAGHICSRRWEMRHLTALRILRSPYSGIDTTTHRCLTGFGSKRSSNYERACALARSPPPDERAVLWITLALCFRHRQLPARLRALVCVGCRTQIGAEVLSSQQFSVRKPIKTFMR